MQRYQHHIRLPEIGLSGQQALGQAKVLVIGAGGLGCPALLYLAAVGVGRIGIVDDDRVELSNLQRQVLYAEADVGQFKVDVAARKLRDLNSDPIIEPYCERLCSENALELMQSYDLIVDGTDNYGSKYLINDATVILNKTLVSAGIQGFRGALGTYSATSGCYRCLFPKASPAEGTSCSDLGVVGALPGVLGAMQAMEAIKAIVQGSTESRFMEFDFHSMQTKSFRLQTDPQCLVCGEGASITSVDTIRYQTGIPDCRQLSWDEAQALPSVLWVDIREEDEFLADHLPGAIHRSSGNFSISEKYPEIIIIYCQTGRRCERVWHQVQRMPNVHFLRGGLDQVPDGQRGADRD